MRGRNNRRGSNPLTRVYESNGPDVKVRGTAHHIAEKYQQLARDAQASGDPVAAENYFQHAEHYLRLIAAMQGQVVPQQGFGQDDLDDDDMDDVSALDAPQPFPQREQREQRDNRMEARGQRDSRDGRSNGPRRNRDDEQSDGFQSRDGRDFRAPRPRDEAGEMVVTRAERPVVDEEEPAPAEAPEPRRSRRPARDDEAAAAPSSRSSRTARGVDEQDLGLPSFITGAPAAGKDREAAGEDGDEAGDGRVSRRRRRFRRSDRIEGADGVGEEGASADASGEPEQQPLFGE